MQTSIEKAKKAIEGLHFSSYEARTTSFNIALLKFVSEDITEIKNQVTEILKKLEEKMFEYEDWLEAVLDIVGGIIGLCVLWLFVMFLFSF
jgi:hypothetical protein